MPKVDPKSVDGRIAQLRAQARSEAQEKRDPSNGEGERSGWAPPAEYDEVQYTDMEKELREAVQGPDATWLEDERAGEPGVCCARHSLAPRSPAA